MRAYVRSHEVNWWESERPPIWTREVPLDDPAAPEPEREGRLEVETRSGLKFEIGEDESGNLSLRSLGHGVIVAVPTSYVNVHVLTVWPSFKPLRWNEPLTRETVRDRLKANLFDGDDDGLIHMRVSDLLDSAAEILADDESGD